MGFGKLDAWLLPPILVGLVLRLIRLDTAPLWLDETFTVRWIALPWNEMLHAVLADNHLPLYFVLAKAWTGFMGGSPWAIRLLSVVFSWSMVSLVAATAATLSGKSAARWAAWLTALSPYLLQHGQEARMYTFLGSLAALNFFLVARFIAGKAQRLGLGFVLVSAAMLATHYYAVFLIAVELPILLLLQPYRWRAWLPAVLGSCILFLGPVLAAKYLATPHAGGTYEGMGMIALPGMVWAMLTGYTLMPTSAELHAIGLRAALPYVPIALVMLVALAIIALRALQTLPKPTWILLLGALFGILLGPLAMSLVFDIGINPRYAMTGTPAFMTFLACGLAVIAQRRSGKYVAAALLTAMLSAAYLHLHDPGHGREDVLKAGEWLAKNVPVEEDILITSEELAILARFHWPQRRFINYPLQKSIVDRGNVAAIVEELPFANHQRAIFMIGRAWLSDPRDLLIARLGKRFQDCGGTEVRGIRILCITSTPIEQSR